MINKPHIDQIIPLKEFRKLLGISRTTEWRKRKKGLLPKMVVDDDGKILGYLESSYREWIKERTQ